MIGRGVWFPMRMPGCSPHRIRARSCAGTRTTRTHSRPPDHSPCSKCGLSANAMALIASDCGGGAQGQAVKSSGNTRTGGGAASHLRAWRVRELMEDVVLEDDSGGRVPDKGGAASVDGVVRDQASLSPDVEKEDGGVLRTAAESVRDCAGNQEGWHFSCERGCTRDNYGEAGPRLWGGLGERIASQSEVIRAI